MALTLHHADDFNRTDTGADGLNGQTMSDGVGAWASHTTATSDWRVVSNKARRIFTTSTDFILVDSVMSTSAADQKSEAKLVSADCGVVCRWRIAGGDPGNYYLAYIATLGGAAQLYYYNGSFNAIGSSGGTFNSLDVLGIDAIGTAITAYVNGSSVTSGTDSNFSTGECGLYAGGTNAPFDFDDFADYIDAGGDAVPQVWSQYRRRHAG